MTDLGPEGIQERGMTHQSNVRISDPEFTLALTDAAAQRVREVTQILGFPPESAGLRVHVVEGGCSGLNYDVQVVERPAADDTVLEISGVKVFVNDFSAPYVNGLGVDWISTFQESRFVFRNPNASGGCGCGVSFTVE